MELIPAVSVRGGRAVVANGDAYADAGQADDVVGALAGKYERILVVDIDALEGGEPQLKLLQRLSDGDAEIWLDAGVSDANDLVHPFVAGASVMLAGTKSVRRVEAYAEIFEASGQTIPSIDLRGSELIWCGDDVPSLGDLLARLRAIGYDRAAVVDFGLQGRAPAFDVATVRRVADTGLKPYVGGATLADVPVLEETGAAGAFLTLRSVLPEVAGE